MSYQVLARKWRPQRFSDVVGQQHVLSALENGLREGRLHHAYLFSGTRGVGKTSIARLFAKGLNCETGITATPCGKCAHCKAIEEGRFIDLIEIDAASRTKVEDTRELLDNVQYKPTVGRFKVYLIDEVHMLSRHSFNALLKTLEEPPEYVKFLLATTDPQKLPITILSRCMQFHLRALDTVQISEHLAHILQQEQIPFEMQAVEKLAKSANGSIRDALSLTDQAIAVSNANVNLPVVQQMLGLIDDDEPQALLQALALADGEKAMQIIQCVAEKGVEWGQLLNELAETLHQVALLQLLPNVGEQDTLLHALARQLAPEDVQFFYHLMLTGKKELPLAPEPRSGVEMVILRALAFHPKRTEAINAHVENVAPTTVSHPQDSADKIAQLRQRLQENTPVVSSETAKPQPKATQQTSNADKADKATAAEILQSTQADENMQNFANPTPLAEPSLALNALQARQQLKAKKATFNQAETEKKKPDLTPTQAAKPHAKLDLQQRFASLAEEKTTNATPKENTEQSTPQNDEDYRWTWLNPELENDAPCANPSEIKQAILQERTPELVNKTIQLSCERDEWCNIVHHLKLGGLSRQVALNSYLAERTENALQLVLKPSMAHLDNAESRQNLAAALQEKGLNYQLQIGESQTHFTPLELRRQIFEELTENARQALNQDQKLQLLQTAFGAEIDESTIRAVAE